MTSPGAAEPPAVSPAVPLDADGVPDFTIRREPHTFRVDDDLFSAPPVIGGFQLRKLGQLHGEFATISDFAADPDRLITLVADMFKTLVPGPSGLHFAARMMADGDPEGLKPIGLMDQAMPIMYWLLEQYGLRPTVPSSPSVPGSTDGQTDVPSGGTSSTAGASVAASTS